jgi:GxxExxY protein
LTIHVSGSAALAGFLTCIYKIAEFRKMKSIYKTEIAAIIWAGNEVHRQLGTGFLERIYQDALEQEFKLKKIPFQREAELKIHYKNILLPSYYYADFVCFDKIAVEIRVVRRLTRREHGAELMHCLKASDLRAGLVLNFGRRSLQVKKRYR